MAKQSKQDRKLRLSEGRCPVHGGWMGQVDIWYEINGVPYTIVGCSSPDCKIHAKAYDFDGPWEILPEFEYLFQQN